MKIEEQFRNPTPPEKQLIQRLLTVDFPGKEQITRQLANVQVRRIDDEGSLELQPGDASDQAVVERSIPIEAEGADEDGVHVHLLLHVLKGFVSELEVYKDDGSPIKRMPHPQEFEIVVLPFDWPSKS